MTKAAEFELFAEEFDTVVLKAFRSLVEKFEPGDKEAFAFILESCHKVDITPKQLSDMADVSPNTIKRWTESGSATKYHQRGLVQDILEFLDSRDNSLPTAVEHMLVPEGQK